jgi:23S rRNA (cytosine1962-C5)-methyltransferase
MSAPRLILRPGREKPVLQGHPWVFSGAIARIDGEPAPSDLVDVMDSDGYFLAQGYWNPRSSIQARLLSWKDERIDDDWWRAAFARAIAARRPWLNAGHPCRLINAESDWLPGLVVDHYPDDRGTGRWLVLQALTLGIDMRKQRLAELLADALDITGVYDRSDVDIRKKEGLPAARGLLWGRAAADDRVLVREMAGYRLWVDVMSGHKTGHYLDQQANHARLSELIAQRGPNQRVLNLFSYTGSFGLAALSGGAAHVTNLDSSLPALELADANREANGLPADHSANLSGDAFQYLRAAEEADDSFDVIICDPPKFAQSAGQVERATRGYKDLNLRCFRLLNPGGLLMTYSCSGAISRDLFHKVVFGALVDSGRQAQIIAELSAGADHPVALTFPEGEYLKGLLLRVY